MSRCLSRCVAPSVAVRSKSGMSGKPSSHALAVMARGACLCGFLTTLSATSTPPEPVSPAYKLAAWSPRPTPTRPPSQPSATPTPQPTAPVISPTPTRTSAPAAGVPLPMPGTIRITLEIQADGQPWGVPTVYEIRTSDATKPLCEFLFDAPCISKIVKVSR